MSERFIRCGNGSNFLKTNSIIYCRSFYLLISGFLEEDIKIFLTWLKDNSIVFHFTIKSVINFKPLTIADGPNWNIKIFHMPPCRKSSKKLLPRFEIKIYLTKIISRIFESFCFAVNNCCRNFLWKGDEKKDFTVFCLLSTAFLCLLGVDNNFYRNCNKKVHLSPQ